MSRFKKELELANREIKRLTKQLARFEQAEISAAGPEEEEEERAPKRAKREQRSYTPLCSKCQAPTEMKEFGVFKYWFCTANGTHREKIK